MYTSKYMPRTISAKVYTFTETYTGMIHPQVNCEARAVTLARCAPPTRLDLLLRNVPRQFSFLRLTPLALAAVLRFH